MTRQSPTNTAPHSLMQSRAWVAPRAAARATNSLPTSTFDTNGNGQADSGDDYWSGGAGWAPIGRFSATLQGNSHSISSLYVDRASERSVGLFSQINDSAEIRRVGLNKITVTGGREVGGLVGYNSGTVNASYATGSVTWRPRSRWARWA